jgi:erythromycin esterase
LKVKLVAQAGRPLPVDLVLSTGARIVHIRLRDLGAGPLQAPRVVATRISDEYGDVFLSDRRGDEFILSLDPREGYEIEGSAEGREPGDVPLGKQDSLELPLESPVGDDQPPPAEVQTWLKDHAVPLASVEPARGFDDLRRVGEMIGDARVVALGEATHGTREFFQLKHRMLEYLVAEKGFDLFAIEASYPDTLPIGDYVLGGPGEPRRLVEGMRFWTWATEEVADMVRWVRAWNDTHAHKVEFQGFDLQSPPGSVRGALGYLGRRDPAAAAALGSALAPLESEFLSSVFKLLPKATQDQANDALVGLEKELEARRDEREDW